MPVARMHLRLASLLTLLCCALVPARPAAADPVRVFLVGNKQRVQDATSVATFRDKMFYARGRVAARSRPVQDGVDDVASHLVPRDPSAPALAVVHFPESVG